MKKNSWVIPTILLCLIVSLRANAAPHDVKVKFTTEHGALDCHLSYVPGREGVFPDWAKKVIDAIGEEETGYPAGEALNIFKRDKLVKFITRDDDNHRPVTKDNPLEATVKGIPGGSEKKFVFDISEYRQDAKGHKPSGMKLEIWIDDKVEFQAHGGADNIRHWTIDDKGSGLITISPHGDRELILQLK